MKKAIFFLVILVVCAAGVSAFRRLSDDDNYGAPSLSFPDSTVVKLIEAAINGDEEDIRKLIARGVDVNFRGRRNITPLMYLLLKQDKKGFDLLLKVGANPNIIMNDGFSVMNKSAEYESPEWLKAAIKYGGDVDLGNNGNKFSPGDTPIFYAISARRVENAKVLLSAKANPNIKNQAGRFPLRTAAGRQAYDIVYLLLDAGADVSQKDAHGSDLLSWLSSRNEEFVDEDQRINFRKVVEFLRAKGHTVALRKN